MSNLNLDEINNNFESDIAIIRDEMEKLWTKIEMDTSQKKEFDREYLTLKMNFDNFTETL